MAARKKKRMSAQVVEDEDYQLHYEKVAGIDVAKESAAVCIRLPPAEGKTHRMSHLREVIATVPAITELAWELKTLGVQMVNGVDVGLLAHMVHRAGGCRAGGAAGELLPGPQPARPAEDG